MTVRYRSFFWPALLILIGVTALLANANIISVDQLARLADLWPLILVVIGLELIVGRALQGRAADVAALLIALLAAGGALAYIAAGPHLPTGTQTLDASDPLGGLSQATVQIDVGAASMTVRSSDLGSDLYRAHITYSGQKPSVNLDTSSGELHISQGNSGFTFLQTRRFDLDLQINSQVAWKINTNTGASTDTFKLGGVNVTSMTLNTGASREDITLGPPTGTVQITVDGGAPTVHLHRPSGTQASVDVSGGFASLDADGHGYHGIGSESWQSDGYDSATDRYQVMVNGGASTVTMDTSSG
jgi:hypothetical protein